MKNFEEIKSAIDNTHADAVKAFEKGNKSAMIRYRASLLKIMKLCKEERVATKPVSFND